MAYRHLTDRMIESGFLKIQEAANPLVVLLRICSAPVVIFCVHLKIHPNAVTTLSLILGCLGALFFYAGDVTAFVWSWSIAVILDYADGIIARKAGKESRFGYLFDMLSDRVKLVALLLAWAAVLNDMLSILMAAMAIGLLLLSEVAAHLLVPRSGARGDQQISISAAVTNVFARFDMHTFFIYGLAIAVPGVAGYVATGWLVLALGWLLIVVLRQRLPYDATKKFTLNRKIKSRLGSVFGRSGK